MVGHLLLGFAVSVTLSIEVLGTTSLPSATDFRAMTNLSQGRNTISGLVFGSSRDCYHPLG